MTTVSLSMVRAESDFSEWVGPNAHPIVVIEWMVMPLAALVVYLIAEAALRQMRLSERRARISAWLVTFGFWEVAMLVASALGQFTPAPITSILGYCAGFFVILTLFSWRMKILAPATPSSATDEAWP